jgi:hypothetical protein
MQGGGEGSGGWRKVVSATSSRRRVGGSFGAPGTGGDLRGRRRRGARTRGRGSLGPCLGGRGRWREPFQGRMAALYSREREHEARGSTERARPVSANGVKRGGVGGCCGLRCAVGCCWRTCRLRGGRVQRVQVMAVGRGPGCSSPFHSLSHGLGRGWGGWARQRRAPRAWLQALGEEEQ